MTIRTRPATDEYRDNFDRIFRNGSAVDNDGLWRCIVCSEWNHEWEQKCMGCWARNLNAGNYDAT